MTNLEKEAISVKPEKFSGHHFRRWQKQLKYWLTVLGLMSVIEEPGQDKPSSSWLTPEEIEYHCYNRILSALSDLTIFMMCITPQHPQPKNFGMH